MRSGFGKGFQRQNVGPSSGFNINFGRVSQAPSSGIALRLDIGNAASYAGSGETVVDLEGNSNAMLVNGPTYSAGYLTFNGTNQYLITKTSLGAVVPTDIVSISIWVYPQDNGVILSERGESSLVSGWHDSQMEMVGGVMKFGMWQASGHSPIITSSIATPLNTWYNFTIVYNGTKLIAYVNGSSAGEVTFVRENPVETGNGLFYAVAAGDSTSLGDATYANMRLGQLLVYNSALSASEVLNNFESQRSLYGV
jgi:hypothetical protein